MQKFIRISAIISVVLMSTSLLFILFSLPLQRFIAENFYAYSGDILNVFPHLPLIPFLSCFLRLGCLIPLIFCCGNKKGGIWLEIIVFIALAVVLPSINMLSPVYSHWIAALRGNYYIAANSFATTIANYCLIPGNLGQALAFATCGMSIVYKKIA